MKEASHFLLVSYVDYVLFDGVCGLRLFRFHLTGLCRILANEALDISRWLLRAHLDVRNILGLEIFVYSMDRGGMRDGYHLLVVGILGDGTIGVLIFVLAVYTLNGLGDLFPWVNDVIRVFG